MFSFKQKTADEMRISDWSSDVCSSDLAKADWWARKVARMPADGIVIAKEAFRLVEQTQAYQGEETASYLFHAFGTNLQFDEGEYNFVKTRAQLGTKQAFALREEHFELPEPSARRPEDSGARPLRPLRSTSRSVGACRRVGGPPT